jgi:hypothetical protein
MATKKAVKKTPVKKIIKKAEKIELTPVKKPAKKTESKTINSLTKEQIKSEQAKIKATKKGDPYIQVLGIELDPTNPTFGAFTLDWNALFVKQLKSLGYVGESDENIIDAWFKTICRHVYIESFENDQAQTPGNGRRIKTTKISSQFSEVR